MGPSSSSSACFTAVAACKTERDFSAMVSGKDVLSSACGFQFGITRKHPESSNSSLKVSKDSHRIRKPPLPLPQVQYRPPIIIHTYSPKVIHTQPDDFMSLVQKLTGSSDTRVRLKKSPSSKKDEPSTITHKETGGAGQSADATIFERQGSGGSSSATVNNCGSPSSSEDSASFLVTDQSCHGSAGEAATCIKQSNSPRSPLDSNFEFQNVSESLFNQFSHFADPSVGSSMFNPQVKAEPMFSSHENNSFNFFGDFMQHPGLLQAATSKPAPKPVQPRPQMHQQHQDLMSLYIENVVPPPGLLTPNLMAGLPDLSPQGWSQSNFLDCLSGASPGSHFVNQAPYLRQRQFSGPSYTPSPEGSTMVALENIHAFMLT